MSTPRLKLLLVIAAAACMAAGPGPAAASEGSDSQAGLAQELTNPIAKLVAIPIPVNFDGDIGPADRGGKVVANIQPVIPFDANDDWNLIMRTIAPIVYQDDIFPGEGSQFGLGHAERRRLLHHPLRRLRGRAHQLHPDHPRLELHHPPVPAARRDPRRELDLPGHQAGQMSYAT